MVNKLSNFIDEHLQIVRASVSLVALAGAYVVLKRSHVLKIYRNVQEIPDQFVSKSVALRGTVQHIDVCGILHVAHQSAIFPRYIQRIINVFGQTSCLKLRIAGVEPRIGFINHIHEYLLTKEVGFILIYLPRPPSLFNKLYIFSFSSFQFLCFWLVVESVI